MVRAAPLVRGIILVAWIAACSGSGEKAEPDGSAPQGTATDASSSASCTPERCPSIPEAGACCLTPSGPCGFQRDNACWAMLPDFSMEAGPEASPDENALGDAAPFIDVDALSCPHEQACALACSSVNEGPCAVAGFASLCFERCCAETAALDDRCAECLIAGLTPEIRCSGTCRCGVSFYQSPACVALCQGAADAGVDDAATPLEGGGATDGSGIDGG